MPSTNKMEIFSERFDAALEGFNGGNASAFARTMGLQPSTISNYINGHSWPDLETLLKIANKLNVRVAWLLGEDVDPSLDSLRGVVREWAERAKAKQFWELKPN